jgi:CSLREA domain-containing protein
VAAALALLLVPAVALAQTAPQTFQVNSTADPGVGGCNAIECTLREAVNTAGSSDTINVPAGQYVLSAGELVLSGDTINGAGARSTIIDGNGTFRVLRITGAVSGAPLTSKVNDVTIRRGNAVAGPNGPNGDGGGIYVQSGDIELNRTHVLNNTATRDGGGIAVETGLNLTLVGSTVAGNSVTGRSVAGGGIAATNSNAGLALINSTVAGNSAVATIGSSTGGGISGAQAPRLVLFNTTVAGNSADTGGGIALIGNPNMQISGMNNTLLVGNTPNACAGSLANMSTRNNLVQDSSCTLGGTGDIQGVNAPLDALADNGGPTDTRALPGGSPAINAGSNCQPADQRGIARPQGGACDIGAFEYVAPRLTVTTSVINDNGGTASVLSFRVTRNGVDVAGSPATGSEDFTLEPGPFVVSAALAGYTVTIGGDCSPGGEVAFRDNQTKSCTVVANDNAVLGAQQLPPPVIRENVNMIPTRGTVRVKRPGARRFQTLAENGAQLPVGTTVDALKGRVRIVAASDDGGGTDTAVFYGGIFKISQTKGRKPTTQLALTENLSCGKAGGARIAAKGKKKRRLWGDGSGKFRTKGKHSAATVVGTKWLVEDRCKSTLTRVVRGRVKVRDFAKKKTVTVRGGKRYIARAG